MTPGKGPSRAKQLTSQDKRVEVCINVPQACGIASEMRQLVELNPRAIPLGLGRSDNAHEQKLNRH